MNSLLVLLTSMLTYLCDLFRTFRSNVASDKVVRIYGLTDDGIATCVMDGWNALGFFLAWLGVIQFPDVIKADVSSKYVIVGVYDGDQDCLVHAIYDNSRPIRRPSEILEMRSRMQTMYVVPRIVIANDKNVSDIISRTIFVNGITLKMFNRVYPVLAQTSSNHVPFSKITVINPVLATEITYSEQSEYLPF